MVIKTPHGNIRENVLPAGVIHIEGEHTVSVPVDEGAEKIMGALAEAGKVRDVFGEENTNVGNMFRRIKTGMADLAQEASGSVRITDLLAVDTWRRWRFPERWQEKPVWKRRSALPLW